MQKVTGAIKTAVGVLVGCLVVFVLFEGLSSAILLGWDAAKRSRGFLGSRRHVQFDEVLGWTNRPGTKLIDRYGPGKHVHIDARGLRGTEEHPDAPPQGKLRILCSGDSFTFGKGSDDAETWCARLGAKRSDVEALNAGEEAYGIGQIYLKVDRLSKSLKWDVNVFGFIADDIRRMTTADFVGRNKPVLVYQDGELKVLNSPVQKASDVSLWLRANRAIYQNLRVLELGNRFRQKLAGPAAFSGPRSDEDTARTLGAILAATKKVNDGQGARTLFVFLPAAPDFDAASARWGPLFDAQCEAMGLDCLNALEPIRVLPPDQDEGLIDPAFRHYSNAGNQRVADVVWEELGRRGWLTQTSSASEVAPPPGD